MDRRTLGRGSAALEVSAEGLGCMGMSEFYGSGDEREAITTIHRPSSWAPTGRRVASLVSNLLRHTRQIRHDRPFGAVA